MNKPTVSLLALHAAAINARAALAADRANGYPNWNTVITAERDTREALAAALRAAPWGAQPDGCFVTRCSVTIGSMASIYTLHAPAKQGALATVRDHERGNDYTLTALLTREEARTLRAVERCENRDEERAYAALRRYAGAWLRLGGELAYSPGQEGGIVEIDSRRISARGALVAAGMTKDAAWEYLSTMGNEGGLLSLPA